MIDQFEFHIPTHVLFGSGQLENLHTKEFPGRKALIVTTNGGSAKRHGSLDALIAQLDVAGRAWELFDEVSPNPTLVNVNDAAARARATGCDFVVGLGGGSAIDAAKTIAVAMTNEGDFWQFSPSGTGGKQTPANTAAPIVAITTTAGTGTEVDCFSVITNETTDEKTGLGYPSMYPTLAVVDPDLMMSVPADFTAYQGMDTFFHAAESVINTAEHVVGEMFAIKAIELVAEYLPRAVADGSDREARANMAIANTLAGYYMLCTSEHTIEHAMGSFHESLVHGAGLIMISHEYFDFFASRKVCEEQMVKMARAMGVTDAKAGEDYISALDALVAAVKCDGLKMSDWGITADEMPKIVEKYHHVAGGMNACNPVDLSDEDILGILQRSYR